MRIASAMVLVALALSSVVPASMAQGADPPTPVDREAIIGFLKEHVMGRALETRVVSQRDEGKLEVVFSRITRYSNLKVTETGLLFDTISEIRHTNYQLDAEGKRIEPGKVMNRLIASVHEFREEKLSQELIGFSRIVANSKADTTAQGFAATLRLGEQGLVMEEKSMHMMPLAAGEGRFRAGSVALRTVYSVADGKLRYDQTEHGYYVDLETGERTPTGDPVELVGTEVDE